MVNVTGYGVRSPGNTNLTPLGVKYVNPKHKPATAAPQPTPNAINPYTAPLTDADDNLRVDELTLWARGQAVPGQPNYTAHQQAIAHQAKLDARPKTTPHARLKKAVAKAVKAQWPHCKVESRAVGRGGYKDARTGKIIPMRFGQVGEADLRLTLNGRAIALEIKALETRDKQRESQVRWARRFEAAGGTYAVVHSVDEALAAVKQAIDGGIK